MVYGTQPDLANRTWFFSTQDSELTGNVNPGQIAEGGFRQIRPQSGGKRQKSRSGKSKKDRKGIRKPKRTIRKRGEGKKMVKSKTRRSRR